MKQSTRPWTWADHLEQHKQQKVDMRFVMWNVKSLLRSESLKTVVVNYRLDLVGVVQVRWDKGGTK